MSDVNPDDTRLIEGMDQLWPLYSGAGAKNVRTGVEVELAFFDPQTPDLTPMSVPQNKVVKHAANAACGGDFVRNEPTAETLEVGSIAAPGNDITAVMENLTRRLGCLTDKVTDIGLKRSYFQHLPEKTAADLLGNLMDVPRYQAFFGPPRADMVDVAAYFAVCKSNQVSISYATPQHALDNIRRLYVLAPFLFLASENTAPFNEGQRFTGHAGMHHRAALGARGGIPPHLFTAGSGEEYLRAHIDSVMNNPLFVYYNAEGALIRLPSGTFTSFNALRDQGLNTATNYFFAQSILWPEVKIAALKDDAGNVNGHRYEARMFGVGLHQHQTMLLITAALAFDPVFSTGIDRLLKTYGFNLHDPLSLQAPLSKAYEAARVHNGRYLDIAYGSGHMLKFAAEFADLIEISPFLSDFEDDIQPLQTILRTGWTDAKVNAYLFPSLASALDFQRSYDPEIFEDPRLCAYTLFERELKAGGLAKAHTGSV